ncbi:acyltransferase family protein [Sediminibacillus albus]|nr:acyltransferase [Sediminibacillus albus]
MKKYDAIDFGKFFAMFAIVFIHSQAFESTQLVWLDGEQLNSALKVFARFSVPFFFIASGFLFSMKIKTHHKPFQYFISYNKKLLLLYLSWFVFYAVYDFGKILYQSESSSITGNPEITAYLQSLFTRELFIYGVSNTQYHLWFLPALIWAVAISYLFQRKSLIGLLLVISLGLHLAGLTGQGYSQLYNMYFETRDPFFFGLFYVALGSFIARHSDKAEALARRISIHVYIVAVFALFMLQLAERTWTMVQLQGRYEEYFLSTIPLSLLLFLAVLKYNQTGRGTWINKIGRSTIGIFVIHPFIISVSHLLMEHYNILTWKEHFLYGILFVPFVFITSFIVYQWLQSVKKQILFVFTRSRKPNQECFPGKRSSSLRGMR